jgi:sugar/nucleoside kinase (ribokinase family)
MIEAVVAGHICLDIIPTFDRGAGGSGSLELAPGRLVEVGAATFATGGPVSNTGLALHRLGIATRLIGKVGDDLVGRVILDLLARADPRLAEGMAVVAGEVSSYSVVINPPGVDRMFLHCPGANHTFTADDVSFDRVAAARLFHFGYPPLMRAMYRDEGNGLVEVMRRARATGATTSLDMAMPDPSGPSGQVDWFAILRKVLPYTDLFLPSAEELLFMFRRDRFQELSRKPEGLQEALTPADVADLADTALRLGARLVGLKIGARGLYLRTADASSLRQAGRAAPADPEAWSCREIWSPCYTPEPLVGTTGSGDATIAGFIAALLRGLGPEDTASFACGVGACNVEAADALSGLRSWDETRARIAAGWRRQDPAITEAGWRRESASGLWFGPRDRGER